MSVRGRQHFPRFAAHRGICGAIFSRVAPTGWIFAFLLLERALNLLSRTSRELDVCAQAHLLCCFIRNSYGGHVLCSYCSFWSLRARHKSSRFQLCAKRTAV
jgi:hypothetical protein